jgi:hypothetical protein
MMGFWSSVKEGWGSVKQKWNSAKQKTGQATQSVGRFLGTDQDPIMGRIGGGATPSGKHSFDAAIILSIILFIIDFATGFNGFEIPQVFKRFDLFTSWASIFGKIAFDAFIMLTLFYIIVLRKLENRVGHVMSAVITLILYAVYSYFLKRFFGTGLVITTGVELFFLILYIVYLFVANPDESNALATGILCLFFINVFAMGIVTSPVGFVHLLFGIAIYFLALRRRGNDKAGSKYLLLFLFILDFFLPSILKATGVYDPTIRFSLPVWVIITTAFGITESPSAISWTSFILLLGYILVFALSFLYSNGLFGLLKQNQLTQEEKDKIKSNLNPKTWWERIWGYLDSGINRSMYYASGQGLYEGEVDQNSKKKLGVYIEDLQKNQNDFYNNEKIELYAIISGENFAEEDDYIDSQSIDITLTCAAYRDNKWAANGKIYPGGNFSIRSYDAQSVRCVFEPWQLDKGGYEVRMTAKFNFKTEAYLKRYFVLKERIDALRRKGLIKDDDEILRLNKIDDTRPVAKNSVGPIEIKANERVPAIFKLEPKIDITQSFGIMLENRWKGNLERIKNIQLFFPEGIKIVSPKECTFQMVESNIPSEKYIGYVLYEFTEKSVNTKIKESEKFVRQTCDISISPDILQPGEVTTRYFRMIADYYYSLQEKLSITVKEPEGFAAKLVSVDGKLLTSSSSAVCEVKNDDKINSDVSFKLYEVHDFGEDTLLSEGTENCPGVKCNHDFGIKFNRKTALKCEATGKVNVEGEAKTATAGASAIVKNSPPNITSIVFEPNKANKGDLLKCTVSVSDEDNDPVTAKFSIEGINIAPTEKECSGGCYVEIPTDSVDSTKDIKCLVSASDNQGDKTEKEATVQVVVPTTQAAAAVAAQT